MTAADIIKGSGTKKLYQKVYSQLIDSDDNITGDTNPLPAKLVDSSGNDIGSSQDADNSYHLDAAVIQTIITSTNNSTETNLASGATFTGTADETFGINGIQLFHAADQDCTIYIDQSIDNTFPTAKTITSAPIICLANVPCSRILASVAPYYRIRVTNTGASTTTSLSTFTGMTPIISVLPAELSSTGRLKVQSEDLNIEIPKGTVRGYSAINKFGSNSSIDAGATEEIWDGSVPYIWPTTASITHVRSAVDSAITRNVILEVQGLDTNYDLVVQNVTTDATTSTDEVALGTALRRIHRVIVLDDTTMDQNLWVGPTGMTAATASAIVQAGNNQTLMAQYTVPAGCTAYMTNWRATVNPATNLDPTSMPIRMWARDNVNGYAKQLKDKKGLISGSIRVAYEPYYTFTEKTDIFFTASPVGKSADVSLGFDLILINN